jgi:hypothetical protein
LKHTQCLQITNQITYITFPRVKIMCESVYDGDVTGSAQ